MKKIYLEVRPSPIEGNGAFAVRRILRRTRIIEYTGKRITHALANDLYGREDSCGDDFEAEPHFYLFTVDSRTIIDGSVNGSDARFINHSCNPNCEAIVEDGEVYIDAIRTIKVGEELTYDYHLDIGSEITEEDRQRYACLCGAANCRGTMLAQLKARRLRGGRGKVRKVRLG